MLNQPASPAYFNHLSQNHLPGHLGIEVTAIGDQTLHAQLEVKPHHLAPNGYMHAGSLVTLADTAAGYGCIAHLPAGASGFTTIELKSNHLGTVHEGRVSCTAQLIHAGRTTQVWDAVVTSEKTGKKLVLFRCTQMILYPK
jgi:uncharacterized protein (TIGR00369 family)